MVWRALDNGFEVVYEPSVKARHEHRKGIEAATLQIVEHNRSLVAMLVKSAARARGGGRAAVIGFLAWRLAKPGARLAARLFRRDPLPAAALLRLWGGCWRGLGSYAAARKLAERRRAAFLPEEKAANG